MPPLLALQKVLKRSVLMMWSFAEWPAVTAAPNGWVRKSRYFLNIPVVTMVKEIVESDKKNVAGKGEY